ncbi:hypothetical protein KK101_11635 [Curtobacterium flaccumfaciens pv. oortii]|uniref:hypothetical protein n=1 Tax=Curtobacterium flaccumfaciens TaxID=2035 RepID=UPI001BDEE4AF|nr:hypothetical protein [Curtobacterium flaccumfaciens]MBT1623337.1 hypothetical protein [Curtobacterium flaccumfaciens pv. oortii]
MSAIVLVMAEYMVDDSPLWYRGSRECIGSVDAGTLGLSRPRRDDLRALNDVFDSRGEPDFDWPSGAVRDAHRVEAFVLASRVQLELGDEAQVWCGAGAGIDTVAEAGTAVVLPSARPGTDVEFVRDGARDVRSARAAGTGDATAKAIVHWRALTERVGTRFGDAETRAVELRTAARIQADVGVGAQVVFLSGAAVAYRLDEFG